MKLVECDERDASRLYTVHPAVRDGFGASLDVDTARRGHDAAREWLTASLGGLPGIGSNPSDPITLDLLEEITYHTIAAGHTNDAWHFYWNRIGANRNLFWRLGAYERGERICRTFAGGRPPSSAPLPDGLLENDQAIFVNEWGLYLSSLGRLDAAARCYERNIEMRMRKKKWENASTSNQNLAEVLLLAGRLTAALQTAEEALRLAERADEVEGRRDSYAYRAHIRALRGETTGALADFRNTLHWLHKDESNTDRPLYSLAGVQNALLLARLGQDKEALRLTEENERACEEVIGAKRHVYFPHIRFVLADLSREQDDLDAAKNLLEEAHEWAITRDAKEPLCWSALIRSKIALTQRDFQGTRDAFDDGLRMARNYGFSIYHIDLLLVRAQVSLHQGDANAAINDLDIVLFTGIHPPSETGQPTLLAAADPECGYAWGIAQGRHLLAEAKLLQAAQKLGQSDFAPARFDSLPVHVRRLIDGAREEFAECREIRQKIQDPKIADTKRVLTDLDGGVLTPYPLHPQRAEVASKAAQTSAEEDEESNPTVTKKHVFLSYCRENSQDAAELRDDLVAAGEQVWWDQDILPGQIPKAAIRQAMKGSYAVVLCLSAEAGQQATSGVFPEARDAIAAYREHAPGNIFLIPVRLSACEVPSFKYRQHDNARRPSVRGPLPATAAGRGARTVGSRDSSGSSTAVASRPRTPGMPVRRWRPWHR